MRNQRIVVLFYDPDDRSVMYEEVHYANRELSEKDFKKWYNHIFSEECWVYGKAVVDAFAMYEDAVGDTCELANFWGIEWEKHTPGPMYDAEFVRKHALRKGV